MERSEPSVICGAKTRSAKPCPNAPMKGKRRCRMHGGATPCGAASANFKHGRYSKVISGDLLEHYHDALRDRELLSLREAIALADGQKRELLAKQKAGEAGGVWQRLKAAKIARDKARLITDESERRAKIAAAVSLMDSIIDEGATDRERYSEIASIDERIRKLIAQEQKRLIAMQQMVTIEQMTAIIHAMIALTNRYVADRQARAQMADELSALLNRDELARPHLIEPSPLSQASEEY